MAELFIRMLLGHLVADYLLQSERMAIQKSAKGWSGWKWCFWHCTIYTTSVSVFCWTLNPLVWGLIFLSHFPIDRWSLASVWLNWIGGRNILVANSEVNAYREIRIAFACLVYAIADNTLHLVQLWLIALYLA